MKVLSFWIHSEREQNELFRYVQVRWCLPCIASWDRSECRSPGSSGTAWGTVSAAAWWKRSPWSRKTGTVRKKNFHSFQKVHKLIQFHFFFFIYLFLQCWPTSALLDALHRSVHEILLWCIITFAIYTVARQFYTPHNLPEVGGNSTTFVSVWQLMPGDLHLCF